MKLIPPRITLKTLAPIILFATLLLANTVVNANPEEQGMSKTSDVENAPMHFDERKKRMHKRMGRHMENRTKRHMEQIDTNGDGNVDLNEYLSNAEQRFNEMDADGDQIVTGEEARDHHKSMRIKHAQERKKHHQKMREKHELNKAEESANDSDVEEE